MRRPFFQVQLQLTKLADFSHVPVVKLVLNKRVFLYVDWTYFTLFYWRINSDLIWLSGFFKNLFLLSSIPHTRIFFISRPYFDTNPMAHSPSCSRSWCGGYWGCWSGLPTRWRSVFRLQKWHIVLTIHLGLILVHRRRCWLQFSQAKPRMGYRHVLVSGKLGFLWNKNNRIYQSNCFREICTCRKSKSVF